MGKDPAFLFYSSDFLLGTLVMSFEDKGKYITLLSYMHHNGRINEDTIKLLVGEISDNLKLKFRIDEDGLWYNERLEEEMEKRRKFNSVCQNNGKLGGRPTKVRKRKLKEEVLTTNAEADAKYPFEKFWSMYDKPTEKQSCEIKWAKLIEQDKELIFQKLPAYVEATPERQYRKNPLTYLTRRIWLDEHIPDIYTAPKKSAIEQFIES